MSSQLLDESVTGEDGEGYSLKIRGLIVDTRQEGLNDGNFQVGTSLIANGGSPNTWRICSSVFG